MWAVWALLALCVGAAATSGPQEQDTHNPLEKIQLRRAVAHKERVTFAVNATSMEVDGQWVEVSWSGVRAPSFDDWVGIVAPADADIHKRAPVKYKLASSQMSHILRGEGKLRCARWRAGRSGL